MKREFCKRVLKFAILATGASLVIILSVDIAKMTFQLSEDTEHEEDMEESEEDDVDDIYTDEEMELQIKRGVFPPLVFGEAGEGQQGEAVVVKRSSLSSGEKADYDHGYDHHDFNVYVSDLISVDREIEDTRNPICKEQVYPSGLPDTSVIICFLNEAWTTLVRTVHSVFNTASSTLLREVILVDDRSEEDYLKEPLQLYMERFPKVKIIRTSEPQGPVRSRMIGAQYATGDVLTFFDPHVECNDGWLKPLLTRIHEGRTNVVLPVLTNIDRHTFKVESTPFSNLYMVGGFDWNLHSRWETPAATLLKWRTTHISPIKSPIMPGGIFAIRRDYFFELGSYDDQMMEPGAEDIELSLRTWMCGGSVEVIPCSIVAHLSGSLKTDFRSRKNTFALAANRNAARVAMVWMDEYKDVYFRHSKHTKMSYGDIRPRVELRKNLQCKSFKWYLDNVYTDLFIPDSSLHAGQIQNVEDPDICLTAKENVPGAPLGLKNCDNVTEQVFYASKSGHLRQLITCVDTDTGTPHMTMCSKIKSTQVLMYHQNQTIYNPATKLCLGWNETLDALDLKLCNGSTFQQWKWIKTNLTLTLP